MKPAKPPRGVTAGSPSMARRSSPAQKTGRGSVTVAARTPTRRSGSLSSRSMASPNACAIAGLMELRASGRFKVMMATRPDSVNVTIDMVRMMSSASTMHKGRFPRRNSAEASPSRIGVATISPVAAGLPVRHAGAHGQSELTLLDPHAGDPVGRCTDTTGRFGLRARWPCRVQDSLPRLCPKA